MNDNETVEVPVELIEAFSRKAYLRREDQVALLALLPKPKPRLVAVEDDGTNIVGEYLATLPDLLTVLDEAINAVPYLGVAGIGADIKSRIRTALGVTE